MTDIYKKNREISQSFSKANGSMNDDMKLYIQTMITAKVSI